MNYWITTQIKVYLSVLHFDYDIQLINFTSYQLLFIGMGIKMS